MAIIYTYPVKGTPLAADLLLISDTADGNKSKNATIASLVTSNAIDVVDTVTASGAGITASPNKGDVVIANTGVTSLVAGSNIDISATTGAITISTSASNVDGSGTAGKIPKWSDSNTLTDSVITDQGGEDIIIPRFIKHEGDLNNAFGFFQNGQFLVSVGPSDADQLSVAANAIIMKTDSGTKLAAGPTGVTLYSDENGSTTVSKESLLTYDSGIIVKGGTENSFARGGAVRFYTSTNNGFVGIKGPTTTGTNYEIILPNAVGAANQVLKLPSTIGSTPYQLAWGDAGSGSGTGGFETLPFTTANGYLAGEASLGTYVFQMIAPSNCEAENFKFYNLLAQSAGRTTTVAIYKGVIGDEGAAGELHSAGQIGGVLGAAQIYGSTLTVVDGATAISAGDNIVVCFSIDQDIQPLGVIPITASGGIALTNASPVNNSKLAIHDSTVSLTAAQIQASATTITALEALLTSSAATTSRPFLLIY